MLFKLLLLFTLVPVVELYVLIEVGARIGAPRTVAIVILTGVLGALLARHQGFATLNNVKRDLNDGIIPAEQLISGAFVLAGGLLLLTPGLLTDFIGLCCLVPPTRNLMKVPLKKWLKRHFELQFESPNGF